MSKTILSSAALLAEVLTSDKDVMALAKKVYPVIAPDEVRCPYVVYRRTGMSTTPDKTRQAADTALIAVDCYGKTYGQSVEMAEAVRRALDRVSITSDDGELTLRSCYLSNSQENFVDGTYLQTLIFTVKL